jgi:hypothetical protein
VAELVLAKSALGVLAFLGQLVEFMRRQQQSMRQLLELLE